MAVTEGKDYVLAESMTYNGSLGIGRGCLLGTMDLILQLPVQTMTGRGRRMENRDWFIEGRPVAEFVRAKLQDPSLDHSGLERLIRELAADMEGAELVELSVIRRLKARTSLLSKGIYVSEKDSGPGWRAFPLKKSDAAGFADFYRGHPASVGG